MGSVGITEVQAETTPLVKPFSASTALPHARAISRTCLGDAEMSRHKPIQRVESEHGLSHRLPVRAISANDKPQRPSGRWGTRLSGV